ncbi:MAG: 2-oxoacid:acceptor oxidoreductase family protein [Vicinamibacteria bacterium]|nr:2-oxoacid:acceptor oxidoreductase family protein [Vicinamibacteria bacterium]
MATNAAFYERFERHAGGTGLKGVSTHYCPGCGHGLVHKFIAESLVELGIAERTVTVSPVGCSVFLYYYMDTGNTQAAHGRAPAVAIGQKLAHPESIVISYQGDGDLASIGLAEIFGAAQTGIPISVIFVNNAIYGMTGGQLAPTSLVGQKTATSPYGRGQLEGLPLKMAEMIALMDGPVFVERVALFDAKNRVKAKKAIKKSLQAQVDSKGFTFVEVLAECPTHLGLTPPEAEKWVKEKMLPVYPLGVKKELAAEAHWAELPKPTFEPDAVAPIVGAGAEAPPRFATGFPHTAWGDDISFKLAGSGGDGAQTTALLLARAAIHEGFDATHIPSYGPESRGGTSYADVHVAAHEVGSPAAPKPHVLLAFNGPSLTKFGPMVAPGGVLLYDTSVAGEVPEVADGVRVVGVPFTRIAKETGYPITKSIVALGAMAGATNLLPRESFLTAIRVQLGAKKQSLLAVNEAAFAAGYEAAQPKN